VSLASPACAKFRDGFRAGGEPGDDVNGGGHQQDSWQDERSLGNAAGGRRRTKRGRVGPHAGRGSPKFGSRAHWAVSGREAGALFGKPTEEVQGARWIGRGPGSPNRPRPGCFPTHPRRIREPAGRSGDYTF